MHEYLDEFFFFEPDRMRKAPNVLEVGVFTLDRAKALRKKYRRARIVLCEGSPANYKKLVSQRIPRRVRTLQYALADRDGPVVMYEFQPEFQSSFSLYPRHTLAPHLKLKVAIHVEGLSLMSLLDECRFEVVDLLLLNCEGGEVAALRDLAKCHALRCRVPQVCTSFHTNACYEGKVRMKLLCGMEQFYDVHVGGTREVPYYLFLRRDSHEEVLRGDSRGRRDASSPVAFGKPPPGKETPGHDGSTDVGSERPSGS
jgi:FkbM family methyltransferase